MQSNYKKHAYLLTLLAFILSACAGQQTSTKSSVMAVNVKEQVDQFKTLLKNDPRKATISHKKGYSGGGALGLVALVLLIFCAMVIFRTPKRKSIK